MDPLKAFIGPLLLGLTRDTIGDRGKRTPDKPAWGPAPHPYDNERWQRVVTSGLYTVEDIAKALTEARLPETRGCGVAYWVERFKREATR